MAITVSGVSVPQQSKTLDTTEVTTSFGIVQRQIIGIADPENQSQYARLTGTSLNVNVTNTSVAISATSLPLPTGAATSALQTTGNDTLSAIDTKLGGTLAVNVGLTDAQLRASNVNVAVNAALPTGSNTIGSIANTSFAATQSGTWNVTNISGTVSLPTGAATETTVAGLLTNTQLRASAVETTNKASSFSHITTNTTTTVKSGAGVLRRVVINTRGGITNTLTIYDNTTATGAVIAVIDTAAAGGNFEYGANFSTGLTVVLAGGIAADITIIYE